MGRVFLCLFHIILMLNIILLRLLLVVLLVRHISFQVDLSGVASLKDPAEACTGSMGGLKNGLVAKRLPSKYHCFGDIVIFLSRRHDDDHHRWKCWSDKASFFSF